MARVVLILIFLAVCLALAAILHGAVRDRIQSTPVSSGALGGEKRGDSMASNGISKAAYVALIIILFGVASGWLGSL